MSERTPYDGDRTGADVPAEPSELVDLAAVARDDALVEALRRRAPRRELDRLDGFGTDPVAGLLAALAADVDLLAGIDRDAAAAPARETLTAGLSGSAASDRTLAARLPAARAASDVAEVAGSAAEVLPLRPAGAGRVARGSRRAGAAAVVVAGLVSVSGVAAALTGDPLAPYVGVARGIAQGISHGVAAVTSGGSATADGRRPQPVPTGVASGRPDGLPTVLASGTPVGSPAATAAQLEAGLAEVGGLISHGRDADAAEQLTQLEQLLHANQGALPADQVRTWQARIDALQQDLPEHSGQPADAGQPSARPTHPTQAADPSHPAHPVRPTHPEHPTQAATPTTGQHGKPAPSPSVTDEPSVPAPSTSAPTEPGASATATAPTQGNGNGNGKGAGNGNGNGNGKGTGGGHGLAHGSGVGNASVTQNGAAAHGPGRGLGNGR